MKRFLLLVLLSLSLTACIDASLLSPGTPPAIVTPALADLPMAATSTRPPGASGWRQGFVGQYGSPDENPDFWSAISPDSCLADLSGPIQLHRAKGDEEVPVAFSTSLYARAQAEGVNMELYLYKGDNHNISNNFSQAMLRTIPFFKENLR